MLKSFAFAVLVGLVGCGASTQSIPVQGEEEDVGLMAGHWEGSYVGASSGRSGVVVFDLTPGHHVAVGQVLMREKGDAGPGKPLQVEFVRADRGRVQGKIRPYTDPACNCQVESDFLGDMKGNQIAGTFTTKNAEGKEVQQGTWEVLRK